MCAYTLQTIPSSYSLHSCYNCVAVDFGPSLEHIVIMSNANNPLIHIMYDDYMGKTCDKLAEFLLSLPKCLQPDEHACETLATHSVHDTSCDLHFSSSLSALIVYFETYRAMIIGPKVTLSAWLTILKVT